MLRNRLMTILGLILVASMLLSACGAPTEAPATPAPAATTVLPTPSPRKGGWLDEIVFSVVASDSAVTQLKAGAIDIYASGLASADLPTIKDAGLDYGASNGLYYGILYNPAVFKDETRLNPFSNRKIREATNWLYDRNYINQEVYAGGGLLKFFAIGTNGPDYADLADVARKLESKYAPNLEKAKGIIKTEMEGMGATAGADGKWMYKDKPVSLAFLIRTDSDGTRKPIGDYVANQLESVGFTVDRQYKKSSEAGPIWLGSDPVEGQWNLYTAAWSSTQLSRDDSGQFQQMYLPTSIQGDMVFQANKPDPEFQKVGDDLFSTNFSNLDQRREMMVKAMELSLQDSLQVWLIDGKNYAPHIKDVVVTNDLAAGYEGAQIWPYTARFAGKEGGQLKWAEPDLFAQAWNPVAGSNWAFDNAAIRATAGGARMLDPYTGLAWPLRLERAELVAKEGLPIGKSLDWIDLKFEKEIKVPADAWVDWDAKAQKFITAGDAAKAKDQYGQVQAKSAELAGAVDLKAFAPLPQKETPAPDANAPTPDPNAPTATPAPVVVSDAGKALVKAATDLGAAYATISGNTIDVAAAFSSEDSKKAVEDKVAEISGLATDDEKKAAISAYLLDTLSGLDTNGFVFGLGKRDVSVAKTKITLFFPENMSDTVKWHDGSPLTAADFVFGSIMLFDQAKKDSPIYDEAAVPTFDSFISSFKGMKFVSTKPLTIEYYSDLYALDAELNVGYTPPFWPATSNGDISWHSHAIANMAESAGELAYSQDKSEKAKIEETSFIGGPSLEILKKYLDKATAESYIPYAPTMSQFVTADEAKARYGNLAKFYAAHNHFWIGTGPYVLDKVFLTEKSLVLKHFDDFPDPADRWSKFGEPKFADVQLDGAGQVKIGSEATFDVAVTFKGDPYPKAEIKQVKYLLYNAKGDVVSVGEAQAVADGQYKITIPADVTSKLEAGSNKIEVAVIPLPVSVPTFTSLEFVTAP